MTDIVERLRYAPAHDLDEVAKEAADEIERLKEQLHYTSGTCDLAMKHRDAAEADNERLRAAGWAVVNTSHGAGAEHWAACDGMRAALKDTKP